jgi:hypothetical protein
VKTQPLKVFCKTLGKGFSPKTFLWFSRKPLLVDHALRVKNLMGFPENL